MKSRISFFKLSLLRKDFLRFAPAWVLCTIFMLLMSSFAILSMDSTIAAASLTIGIYGYNVFNLFYAPLCVQLLFGDLFKSRLCNSLHALPVRRESWFLTHLVAGALFCIIPLGVTVGVHLLVLGEMWFVAILWASTFAVQFLLYFSLATLSAMLVGNRFALVVVYTIFNFISPILMWLVNVLYLPLLTGVVMDSEPWLLLCPFVQLFDFNLFTFNEETLKLALGDGWPYLAICVIVSVVLLVISMLLYRKRKLERAGDFLAFRSVSPVFLLLYTLCVGAMFDLFGQLFLGDILHYVFMAVGLSVGYFTGMMLLRRTVRVFKLKVLLFYLALMGAFVVTLIATWLDPLGFSTWVPKVSTVKSVTVTEGRYEWQDCSITDPELIGQVTQLHRYVIEHPDRDVDQWDGITLELEYTNKAGVTTRREYLLAEDTPMLDSLRYLYSQPEVVFGNPYTTADALAAELKFANANDAPVSDPVKLRQLAEALIADAEAGLLYQDYELRGNETRDYIDLTGTRKVQYSYGSETIGWYISVPKGSRTWAWAEENLADFGS